MLKQLQSMPIHVDNKHKHQNSITTMKPILHIITLALLVLSPLHLCGQNFPPLDRAQTFSIHSSATGQDIGDTPAQIRQIMGTPTSETHESDESFGKHLSMYYGTSSVNFTEDFDYQDRDFWMYSVELNDQRMFMRVNDVDIRVGDLAEELAEHFPKSWEARRFNWPSGDGYPKNEIMIIDFGDVTSITILINPSTGLIRQIEYSVMLT